MIKYQIKLSGVYFYMKHETGEFGVTTTLRVVINKWCINSRIYATSEGEYLTIKSSSSQAIVKFMAYSCIGYAFLWVYYQKKKIGRKCYIILLQLSCIHL